MLAMVGGASLFVLGVREAIALRDADLATARGRARQLGIIRASVGLMLMAKPRLLAGALGWNERDGAAWWPRLVAVRELCLGLGTVNSSRKDADPGPWLMTIATVDGVEGLVLVAALTRRAVDPAGASGYVAADFGSATAVVLRAMRIASSTPQSI